MTEADSFNFFADTCASVGFSLAEFVISSREGNVLVSPPSIYTVLCLLYQGATGEMGRALKSALRVPDQNTSSRDCRALLTMFKNLRDANFYQSRGIFLQDADDVQPDFLTKAKNNFETELVEVTFNKKGAPEKKISGWTEQQTHRKVIRAVGPKDFTDNTRLMIVCGAYFKADWLQKFEQYDVKKDTFYITDSETIKCQMVKIQATIKYCDRSDITCQIICLPYKNSDVSLMIFLPKTGVKIKEFEYRFFKRKLSDLYAELISTYMTATFPKFKIETTIQFQDALSKLGLGELFTGNAEFPNMFKKVPFVADTCVQKVAFEIGDRGSFVSKDDTNLKKESTTGKLAFHANRPFAFAVCYHHDCFLPLLMGRVEQPVE